MCNVYTIQHYGKTSFNFKVSLMRWYKKIPYVLWHWLALLTYYPYIHHLIYIISCVIIDIVLLNLLMWLVNIPWLLAVVLTLIIASAAVFYTNCIYSLFKRKKKKKTNDNK